MSSFSYQGGKYVDLFSAQGKDPLTKLQLSGGQTVCKEFDPVIKGYVVALSGSPATTRIHLPKGERKRLGITHPILLIQLQVPDGSRAIIEISILDNGSSKRRLQISSLYSTVSVTPLLAKIPLCSFAYDQWVWLSVDISSLISGVYPRQSFQSVEGISLCGTCKVRRIAALRDPVNNPGDLPSPWQPPLSVPLLPLIPFDGSQINELTRAQSTRADGKIKKPMHVAFGERIAVPTHLLKSKPHSGKIKPKSNQVKSSRCIRSDEGTKGDGVTLHQKESTEVASPIPMPHPRTCYMTGSDDGISLIPVVQTQTLHTSDPQSLSPSPSPSPVLQHTHQDESMSIETTESVTVPKLIQSETNSETGSSFEEENNEVSFSYKSPPHSAFDKQYKVGSNQTHQKPGRGAQLEGDFVSLSTSHANADDLDKSYDWQKYQTVSSSDEEDSLDHALPVPIASNEIGTLSTGYDTLKEKLLEFQDPQNDTIDFDKMGGASSPTGTIARATEDEERIELVYDQDLNCFYDPQTGKYYKLT